MRKHVLGISEISLKWFRLKHFERLISLILSLQEQHVNIKLFTTCIPRVFLPPTLYILLITTSSTDRMTAATYLPRRGVAAK